MGVGAAGGSDIVSRTRTLVCFLEKILVLFYCTAPVYFWPSLHGVRSERYESNHFQHSVDLGIPYFLHQGHGTT
jgi:hypothetical protein